MRTIGFEKVTAGFAELRCIFVYNDGAFRTNCRIVIDKVGGMDIRPLKIDVSIRDINKPIDLAIKHRLESITTYDDSIVISNHSRVKTCERGDGVKVISIDEYDGYDFVPIKRVYIQEGGPDGTLVKVSIPNNDAACKEYVVSYNNDGEITTIECC